MSTAVCSICTKPFVPRFSYQTDTSGSSQRYFCSQTCKIPELAEGAPQERLRTCVQCGLQFSVQFAFQLLSVGDRRYAVCSKLCRSAFSMPGTPAPQVELRSPRAIAVMNQKGGTGKTTTSVSVAAGLADLGFRTLLIDLDAQGNVGVSLGIKGPKSLYQVLVDGVPPEEAAVPVRQNLDVITSDQTVALAEIELVHQEDRVRVLRRRAAGLIAPTSPYEYVILDCAPSLSLLNQNALTFAKEVLVPVSCDYLSLVGVKQILATIKHVNDVLLHPIEVLGVLPTMYDVRNRISKEAVRALESYFKDRVMPPIRVNARIKEAPSHKKTIFEYAPESHGAADYATVVEWLLQSDRRASERPREAAS